MDSAGDAGHNRSPEEVSRRYTIYLIVVALAGWSLASYDLNLLVLTIPDIASELKLSSSLVGSLVFFVSAAQFVATLFVGYGMDSLGRKRMWMICLAAAALFTELIMLMVVRLFYSPSFVATNLYITDFMTRVKGITGSQASLICSSAGVSGSSSTCSAGLWGRGGAAGRSSWGPDCSSPRSTSSSCS